MKTRACLHQDTVRLSETIYGKDKAGKGYGEMANYQIGSLIKRIRKQKGLTQEELAYPIIDRATLSKIESGKVTPNNQTLKMLFEKLGFSPDNYANFFLDDEMTDVQKILDELEEILDIYGDNDDLVEKSDVLIAQLENNEQYMRNELNVQYIIAAKAISAFNKKESLEKIREMALKAIKISIPEYNERFIGDYYLSRVDLLILTLITALYNEEGNHDKAIEILYGLKHNFDKHCIDKAEMGRRYPVTITNLAYLLTHKAKKYEEAIEVCESGRKVCIETGRIFFLPVIVGHKAICLCMLGDKEEGIRLLRQAYHSCDLIEMYPERDALKDFAKEELDIDLQ